MKKNSYFVLILCIVIFSTLVNERGWMFRWDEYSVGEHLGPVGQSSALDVFHKFYCGWQLFWSCCIFCGRRTITCLWPSFTNNVLPSFELGLEVLWEGILSIWLNGLFVQLNRKWATCCKLSILLQREGLFLRVSVIKHLLGEACIQIVVCG